MQLEISLKGKVVVSLSIPPEGLLLGSGAKADAILPGLEDGGLWQIRHHEGQVELTCLSGLKTRKKSAATLDLGKGGKIGPYTLTPKAPLISKKKAATRKLIYHTNSHTLEVRSLSIKIMPPKEGPSWTKELPEGRIIVGKDPACDVVLSDTFVSSRHISLSSTRGKVFLSDLGSRNGAFVDGRKVKEAEVEEGQVIQIGRTKMLLLVKTRKERLKKPSRTIPGLEGESPAMQKVAALVSRVAPTGVTVLIEGETGTGKEVVARGIHAMSKRASGPFIPVNCGAIPRDLFESELFGHVRGAFTGAHRDRRGYFPLASEGTLFLDEIGELPADMQVRLLRVLDDFRIRPVGSEKEVSCDVRVIAATNRDLSVLVQEGGFRKDLFYRLRMIPIYLPPLRARGRDVESLAKRFLEIESAAQGRKNPGFGRVALAALLRHSWPGNVRELKTCVMRALVLNTSGRPIARDELFFTAMPTSMLHTLEDIETNAIRLALAEEKTREAAARRLGIAVSTLYEKIKKHRLS